MRYARFETGEKYRAVDGRIHRRLRIAFLWKGPGDLRPRRYRESTGLRDSKLNRALWKQRLAEMSAELILSPAAFDPAKYFPRSRSAAVGAILTRRATVGEAARRYLETLAGDSAISDHTRAQYFNIFNVHVLDSTLAAVPLSDLDDGHIKAWLGALKTKVGRGGRRLEATTVNKVLARLRTFVTLEWKRGNILRPVNPMQLVDNLDQPQVEIRPFTVDELLAIFAATEGQQRGLYVTLAFTGMRPSEALGLWWEHVDFKGGRILVRQQVREDGSVDSRLKTRRSKRDIEMLAPVRGAVAALAAQTRLRGKFVFAGRLGRPLRQRTQGDDPWRYALARAEVDYRTLYTLRHTYRASCCRPGKTPNGSPISWVTSTPASFTRSTSAGWRRRRPSAWTSKPCSP
jgi:integrase